MEGKWYVFTSGDGGVSQCSRMAFSLKDGTRRAEQGQHAIGLGRLARLVEYSEVKRGQRDDLWVGRRGARAQDNLLRVRGS